MAVPRKSRTFRPGLSDREHTMLTEMVQTYLIAGRRAAAVDLLRALPKDLGTNAGTAMEAMAALFLIPEVAQDAALARLVLAKTSRTARTRALFLLSIQAPQSPAFDVLASAASQRDLRALADTRIGVVESAHKALAPASGDFAAHAGAQVDWLSRWLSPHSRRHFLDRFGEANLPRMAATRHGLRHQASLLALTPPLRRPRTRA